jgi:hypothetical protein
VRALAVATVVVATVVVAIAGAIWLAIWALRSDERLPTSPQRAAPPTATPAQVQTVEVDRVAAAEEHGSIAGSVLDAAGRAIPDAQVHLVIDETVEGLPVALCDTTGHFQLLGVPLTVVAIRAGAPGYCSVQLGDLHPENAPDNHLDVEPIALAPSATYRGRVLSGDQGLPGASVLLVAELRAPGQPQPVLQRVWTDADGWFWFDRGPTPPCRLRVWKEGYRDEPVVSITTEQQPLQFHLVPLPHVTGRVVDLATGAALPTARILLLPWNEEDPAGELRPSHSPADNSTVAVDAEGRFDVPLPDAPRFVLECFAPEHTSAVRGPLHATTNVELPTLALARGCTVLGSVTWHGDPIAAVAGLWPSDGRGESCCLAEVGMDGILQLPPAPPGTWLLRVDAMHGARFEQTLELSLPGPHTTTVQIPDGSRLVGRVVASPTNARVLCVHEQGPCRLGIVQHDGTFEVTGLFPGRWVTYVLPDGGRWPSQGHFLLAQLLEPQAIQVDNAPELRRDLVPATLLFARLRGQLPATSHGARVELIPDNATQERVPANLRRFLLNPSGEFSLDPVLPGTWRVRWSTPGSPDHESTITAIAGQEVTVDFLN